MKLRDFAAAACLALAAFGAAQAQAQAQDALRPDQVAFRSLYKELVETNTSLSVGSCTLAAERLAARLKAAGFPDSDLNVFTAPGHPKEGGLVAVLHSPAATKKPILLLAHLDVVEAKREDWVRDPFTLIEEGGYFYARGSSDDKSQAAIWTDLLIRFRQEGYRPNRDIKIALTCGEETASAFNGANWLVQNHKDWIDAAFALNEGAGGEFDAHGKRISFDILASEKAPQDFWLEVTNPGGHSSQPVPDNAIYHLAGALTQISHYEFPVKLNDANRAYFSRMADVVGGADGAAMRAIVKDPADAAADAQLSKNKGWHAMLRTACVATMLDAGHATNALPQRARANINCRIFPGETAEQVRDTLVSVIGDPKVSVTIRQPVSPTHPAPPLTPEILGPIEQSAQEFFPGVPVIPMLQPGATDGRYLTPGGIPTYGVEGIFSDPDLGHIHGLNERIGVKSLYEGRDYLYRLVKLYTQ